MKHQNRNGSVKQDFQDSTPATPDESPRHLLTSQSWIGVIRVVPAMPSRWPEAVFHHVRTEGAFPVSAARQGGWMQCIRIESLAGEPLVLQTDMPQFKAVGLLSPTPKLLKGPRCHRRWTIDLRKGERVLLKLEPAGKVQGRP